MPLDILNSTVHTDERIRTFTLAVALPATAASVNTTITGILAGETLLNVSYATAAAATTGGARTFSFTPVQVSAANAVVSITHVTNITAATVDLAFTVLKPALYVV